MALIWAKGFENEKALAPLWMRCTQAEARAKDTTLSPLERGTALVAAEAAKKAYADSCELARAALAADAKASRALTHAIVIGVGTYDSASIKALTTSVRGAWAFADWLLTRFDNPDCPLGSLELLLSPAESHWQPSPEAAARLGVASGLSIPVEPATFENVRGAFKAWLQRAGTLLENAAFFYFSGHGMWKSVPILLPQDAQLPGANQPAMNLIDIQQTERNMFNMPPSLQCFFIDSCQEIPGSLLATLDAKPADPLHSPVIKEAIERRDACLYLGSYTGRKAYGPANAPPFFTQELIRCLERRGAAFFDEETGTGTVTTNSLRIALEASSSSRREQENEEIQFSVAPGICNFTANVCQIKGTPEVFVKIWCLPPESMPQAKLFVVTAGTRRGRPAPSSAEWYTTVMRGTCQAGAQFEPSSLMGDALKDIDALPPVFPVLIRLKPRGPANATLAGGAGAPGGNS